MDDTVTIAKCGHEGLFQRSDRKQYECTECGPRVVVPKDTYEALENDSRNYHRLRQALSDGGISTDAIDHLIQGAGPMQKENTRAEKELNSAQTSTLALRHDVRHPHPLDVNRIPGSHRKDLSDEPDLTDANNCCDEGLSGDSVPFTKNNKRNDGAFAHTLLLSNLPDCATHKEVTSVIRGGRLVDIWLRKNERTATVTFGEGAEDFLVHARCNDIYIRSKKIDVSWSDRQYSIAPHLRMKLAAGHSRNLLIRSALGCLTDEQIREDMHHIHNLVIIAIVWKGQDVHVSTNSINNATFARNCMISRFLYKGLRIEWYPDECAEPIPKPISKPEPLRPRTAVVSNKPKPAANRFNLLDVDEESSSGDDSTLDAGDES